MTVGLGALSSLARRNRQASFGRRQVVGPGGDSGPPNLLEMSTHFTESRLPPAASNMRPRCSIPGTSVPGLPQHHAGFECRGDIWMPRSRRQQGGAGAERGPCSWPERRLSEALAGGGTWVPECLAWCWGRGVCCLNHQMRTPPQKGRDLGVLHQLLGVTISDQKVPPLSLCSHYPSPPPPCRVISSFYSFPPQVWIEHLLCTGSVPGTRKIAVTKIDQNNRPPPDKKKSLTSVGSVYCETGNK